MTLSGLTPGMTTVDIVPSDDRCKGPTAGDPIDIGNLNGTGAAVVSFTCTFDADGDMQDDLLNLPTITFTARDDNQTVYVAGVPADAFVAARIQVPRATITSVEQFPDPMDPANLNDPVSFRVRARASQCSHVCGTAVGAAQARARTRTFACNSPHCS